MGLTSQQLTYLRTADQRFRARVAVFPAYTPTISFTLPGSTGTALAPKPIPMVTPRLSMVDNGGSILLYARDSYNRGGSYVGDANIAWANTGGTGSLVDNGNGTATYTAPGGSGTNAITMTATNSNGSSDAVCYVQYPLSTSDAVVADVASISGSVEQHGWQLLLRIAGDPSGYTIGSRLLIHVEDTWDGTTSTFGGYQYAEGIFSGYISQIEYFEDWTGQTYVGIECSPLWWLLERLKVGETWWGYTAAAGRFYISNFVPVDAVWKFVTEITDVSKYHNCTLFIDTNIIDDFIVEESNLATIIEDCMARGLTKSFTDRYGSLMCIPDPDVRASEWWGTPAPVFDSAGAGPLTEAYCSDYTLTYNPYQVRKLVIQALDHSMLGIWAISQNTASSLGEIVTWPGRILCDDPLKLAHWVVELRAKMNRKWQMNVTRYLDHTIDLMNFVDVNFGSPSQTNGLTAVGTTWVNSVVYRPNVFDGGWIGNWELYKQTTGDTDGISSWGGTGQFWGGVPEWPSTGPGSGSWGNNTGGVGTFCHTANFTASNGGWKTVQDPSATKAVYENGVGWKTLRGWDSNQNRTADDDYIHISFAQRNITSAVGYFSAQSGLANEGASVAIYINGTVDGSLAGVSGTGHIIANALPTAANDVRLTMSFNRTGNAGTGYWVSALICGEGADPFGGPAL